MHREKLKIYSRRSTWWCTD